MKAWYLLTGSYITSIPAKMVLCRCFNGICRSFWLPAYIGRFDLLRAKAGMLILGPGLEFSGLGLMTCGLINITVY